MTQAARLQSLEKFRKGEVAFLLATDVAARGLDILGLQVCVCVWGGGVNTQICNTFAFVYPAHDSCGTCRLSEVWIVSRGAELQCS